MIQNKNNLNNYTSVRSSSKLPPNQEEQNSYSSWIIGAIFIIILFLLGGLCYSNIHNHYRIKHLNIVAGKHSSTTNRYKALYYFKYNHVQHTVFKNSLNSHDKRIRYMSRNGYYGSLVESKASVFFNHFFTYSGHDTYVLRAKQLQNIATPNVLNNKHYFNDDLDSSGNSIIQSEGGLHSKEDSCDTYITSKKGNNIYLIAGITHDAWKDNYPAGTGEKWFYMTYNTSINKFTSMSTMFTENDINNTNNISADGQKVPQV